MPQELCQLYRASAKLPALEEALRAHEGPHAQLLVDKCAVQGCCGWDRRALTAVAPHLHAHSVQLCCHRVACAKA
jgi:hypothetical protein